MEAWNNELHLKADPLASSLGELISPVAMLKSTESGVLLCYN
jgi:hypothetical protein